MKDIRMISFTKAGAALEQRLASELNLDRFMRVRETSLSEWTREAFREADGIVFIGACGIAVRSIAPFLKSKAEDPAVVVLDERGQFVIPILSGHLGGANELAVRIAKLTGGQPVLTTATDVNGLLAVDVFAKNHRLVITDLKRAKEVSAALLGDRKVKVWTDPDSLELTGAVPEELIIREETDLAAVLSKTLAPNLEEARTAVRGNVVITPRILPEPLLAHQALLQLIPKTVIIGMGCRRGKSEEELLGFLKQVLKAEQLRIESVAAIASIDLKKEEDGLLRLVKKLDVPFLTFPENVLSAVEGSFTASEFVREKTGVDNVCERSVMAAGADRLLCRKQSRDGMTIALGLKRKQIRF